MFADGSNKRWILFSVSLYNRSLQHWDGIIGNDLSRIYIVIDEYMEYKQIWQKVFFNRYIFWIISSPLYLFMILHKIYILYTIIETRRNKQYAWTTSVWLNLELLIWVICRRVWSLDLKCLLGSRPRSNICFIITECQRFQRKSSHA